MVTAEKRREIAEYEMFIDWVADEVLAILDEALANYEESRRNEGVDFSATGGGDGKAY